MALSRLNARQLETFLAIADCASIARAADRVCLTPSAVSQLLGELEREVGFRLFDRTTRRVSLTVAGADFLPAAMAAMTQLYAAQRAAKNIRDRASGVIRVGAPLVLCAGVLPDAIAAYRDLHPNVTIRPLDVEVEQLVPSVADARIDIALGPNQPLGERVGATPLFDSPWVVWCSPRHALARYDVVPWEALRETAVVATGRDHEYSVTRMLSDQPDSHRVLPVEIVENVTTAFGLARAGLSVTLAPDYVQGFARSQGLVMRRTGKPETIRQICLYHSKERELSPAAAEFHSFLVRWSCEWYRALVCASV
ncbi:LysR family transcriptional regulator [Pandoraea faecigallinarum]|uniref:LysR family transcriptional regulator n=1 Tax=Pandoraea faecigallinarum TaxID=656179 RepID=A0A0H3WYI1_9BURK|nr:LysR family transcriptional regulator [Pandoraea faecigallinarum]AKM31718.1 LysR family transcriptional regulator [Pandoraea faecigallinarum]